MEFRQINNEEELAKLVSEVGFLPFFKNTIEGFSIEECTPSKLWFSDELEGPWEWKGPVARRRDCIYGKFFSGRAGFVSLDWAPDFINFRRNGYDFDARYDDGLAPAKDKFLYDTVTEHGELLSKELKRLCHYGKGGNKGFDSIVTRLQMQSYLVIADFEYMRDKAGNAYGWGVAKYAAPEYILGAEKVKEAYAREPEESGRRIMEYLSKLLPHASEKQLAKLLGTS